MISCYHYWYLKSALPPIAFCTTPPSSPAFYLMATCSMHRLTLSLSGCHLPIRSSNRGHAEGVGHPPSPLQLLPSSQPPLMLSLEVLFPLCTHFWHVGSVLCTCRCQWAKTQVLLQEPSSWPHCGENRGVSSSALW